MRLLTYLKGIRKIMHGKLRRVLVSIVILIILILIGFGFIRCVSFHNKQREKYQQQMQELIIKVIEESQ
jgi:hypothetical protein